MEHRLEAADRIDALVDRFFTPRPTEPTPRDLELASEGDSLGVVGGLAARAWGDPSGPVVVLAHGWESRGTHWGIFIPALVKAGFRALAVDAPAHGESPGRHANVLLYARGLVGVGEALGPLAGVIGHSFGGSAAVVALDLGLSSRRAVVISGLAFLSETVLDWGRKRGLSGADLERFAARVDAEVGASVRRFDLPGLVPRLTTPALVVHDREDAEVPLAHGEAVAHAWPGSTLLVTEKLGHNRVLIAREVVRAAVAFLGDGAARVSPPV